MMKRIKTIIISLIAVMLVVFYATGCFSGGADIDTAVTEASMYSAVVTGS